MVAIAITFKRRLTCNVINQQKHKNQRHKQTKKTKLNYRKTHTKKKKQ